MFAGILFSALISTGLACAAAVPAITEAANRLEQQSAKAPAAIRIEFRVLAAKALQNCDPDLAHRFANLALDELRSIGRTAFARPPARRATGGSQRRAPS
jgi:hypothetical protein